MKSNRYTIIFSGENSDLKIKVKSIASMLGLKMNEFIIDAIKYYIRHKEEEIKEKTKQMLNV